MTTVKFLKEKGATVNDKNEVNKTMEKKKEKKKLVLLHEFDIHFCFLLINPFICRVVSFTLTLWTSPFPMERVSDYFLLLPCFIMIPLFNANRVDSDQRPHSVASDLDLHYLPIPLLQNTRNKLWVIVVKQLKLGLKNNWAQLFKGSLA